jgi:hypothetical protein
MIWLVVTLGLAGTPQPGSPGHDPATCWEMRLPLDRDGAGGAAAGLACLIAGPPAIADLIGRLNGETVARWRCTAIGEERA